MAETGAERIREYKKELRDLDRESVDVYINERMTALVAAATQAEITPESLLEAVEKAISEGNMYTP